MIDNKIADKVIKVSKTLPHNNSERVTNEEENIGIDRETPKKRYISPEKNRKLLSI